MTQNVVIRGTKSNSLPVTSGVPQGSVLGPVLFLIFVNDLPNGMECSTKLFADDTKIYSAKKPSDIETSLQNDINKLYTWTQTWLMELNAKKCKQMLVSTNVAAIKDKFSIPSGQQKIEIQIVQEEKDLGVVIDERLKFSEHVHKAVAKANRNVSLIFRNFTYIDIETFLALYKSLVRPHLEYAITVWTPHLKKRSDLNRECPTASN